MKCCVILNEIEIWLQLHQSYLLSVLTFYRHLLDNIEAFAGEAQVKLGQAARHSCRQTQILPQFFIFWFLILLFSSVECELKCMSEIWGIPFPYKSRVQKPPSSTTSLCCKIFAVKSPLSCEVVEIRETSKLTCWTHFLGEGTSLSLDIHFLIWLTSKQVATGKVWLSSVQWAPRALKKKE